MGRRLSGLGLATLAAAVVALPAVAGSEPAPTVEAVNEPAGGIYKERHSWSPTQVSVGEGGTVAFQNASSTVSHGVEWVGGPGTPSCSAGVPVGTTAAASGTSWSGTCSFSKPGTYVFYCTVHGAEMSGRVLVGASGVVSPLPGSSPPGSGTQGSGSAAGEGSSTQGGSGGPPSSPGSGSGSTGPSSSPGGTLFVSGPHALELLRHEHASSVRGSVVVSRAAAGGRLEVSLYADGASLHRASQAARVRVGRRLLAPLRAGDVAFAVTLSPRARAALRRSGRLQLTLRLLLTPVHGSAQTLRRKLLLHT